jgi:hypothetical protein
MRAKGVSLADVPQCVLALPVLQVPELLQLSYFFNLQYPILIPNLFFFHDDCARETTSVCKTGLSETVCGNNFLSACAR